MFLRRYMFVYLFFPLPLKGSWREERSVRKKMQLRWVSTLFDVQHFKATQHLNLTRTRYAINTIEAYFHTVIWALAYHTLIYHRVLNGNKVNLYQRISRPHCRRPTHMGCWSWLHPTSSENQTFWTSFQNPTQKGTHPLVGDAQWWDYKSLLFQNYILLRANGIKCVNVIQYEHIVNKSPLISIGQSFWLQQQCHFRMNRNHAQMQGFLIPGTSHQLISS